MAKFLLKSVDTDTVGEIFSQQGNDYTIVIEAENFGGGQVTLEYSISGTIWNAVEDFRGTVIAGITANSIYKVLASGQGLKLRASLALSEGASNVTVALY